MVGVPDNEIATAVALTVDATVRTVVLLEREAVRRYVGCPLGPCQLGLTLAQAPDARQQGVSVLGPVGCLSVPEPADPA
jgi:hypothetical protein